MPSSVERTPPNEVDDATVLQLLESSIDEVLDVERRADTKASNLATVLALIGAGLVGFLRGAELPVAATTALLVSALPLAAALVRLLFTIRPVFDGAPFRQHAASRPGSIIEECRRAAQRGDAVLRHQEFQLKVHAGAAVRKMASIRSAVGMVLISLAGFACAGVLAVVL